MVPQRHAGQEASEARRTRRAALATLAVSLVAFAFLTWNAVAESGLAGVDPHVQDVVVGHRIGWVTDALRVLTFLGSTPVLIVIVALFGIVLWVTRRDAIGALLPVAALLFSVLAKGAAKPLIERPRPSPALAIGSNTGFAFPSGHAADSLAAFAMLAVILSAGRSHRAKWAIWFGAIVAVLVVGASRVYLGSHWLTDVLGGWALAGIIVSMLVAAFLPLDRRYPPAPPLTPPGEPART